MFNRQKSGRDPQPWGPGEPGQAELQQHAEEQEPASDAGAVPWSEVPEAGPGGSGPGAESGSQVFAEAGSRSAVEEMLARLTAMGGAEGGVSASESRQPSSSEATTHSEALRAALTTQQQAQELLEQAAKERSEATAQAEQVLREAQTMAGRLGAEAEEQAQRTRQQTQAWVANQRREVGELVSELKEAARREAEQVRATAEESAMADARERAAQHFARTRAAAEKDAEAVRAKARDVLDQSTSLLADAQRSVQELADSVGSVTVSIQRRVAEVEDLLSDPEMSSGPPPTDPEDLTEADLARLLATMQEQMSSDPVSCEVGDQGAEQQAHPEPESGESESSEETARHDGGTAGAERPTPGQ